MSTPNNNNLHILKLNFSGSTDLSLSFFHLFRLKSLNFKFLFIGSDFKNNFNIFKIFCLKNYFIFFQFKNIFFYNDNFIYNIYFFKKIRKIWINYSLVFDYWMIFSFTFFRSLYYGLLNIHFSILPFYKGWNPILFIKNNKNFCFGFSLIFINRYIDSGFLVYNLKFFFNYFINFFIFFKYFFLNLVLFILRIFKFNYYFIFYQANIRNIFFFKKFELIK